MRGAHQRAAAAALALAAAVAILASAAVAATTERPANELTKYVASLRDAAAKAEAARVAAAGLDGNACGTFGPAAAKVAEAASSARITFDAYRKANTRYGTQEEIQLIASLAVDLREARGHLARAGGETAVPTQAEQQAASREVSLFQTFLAVKIEDRLEVAGLADVLTSTSFREIKAKVVAELQRRLRDRAEAEIRRLVGFRLRLDVPLKQQIRDFLEGELSSLLSRLSISAGPAGILVSVVGARIVSLIGNALQEALRHKGSLVERTNRTATGFAARQAELRKLLGDSPLDRVRATVRAAERSLAATSFLEGDLARAGRADLLAQLRAAKSKLEITLNVSRQRFLLDSDLVGEDFRIGVAYATDVRADAERLAKKAGCPLTGGGGTQAPSNGTIPTAASCPPPFTMESIQSLPPYAVTGTFNIVLSKLEQTATYGAKCTYLTEDRKAEAFVIFFSWTPPGIAGTVVSGNCDGNRPDSHPFYNSRKRHLGVSGGERMLFTRAAGGNEVVLKRALALAEAQGVGRACS
jgi:hypothetical protein